jgi:hypothetical protein
LINNDYVRGYFDAHGRIWCRSKNRHTPQWCIEFEDRDADQIKRVYDYLVQKGYIVHSQSYVDLGALGESKRNRVQIGHSHEVKRFIEEIGSERPEWKERFAKIIT